MQSIITRKLPCTDYRQARVKATASGGESITILWDWALDSEENHHAAARALIEKLKWHLDVQDEWYHGAAGGNDGNVYVCAAKHCHLELRRAAIPSNWASDMDAQDFDCRR